MSSQTENSIDRCIYCKPRYHSDKCLLPYSVAVSLPCGVVDLSSIIRISDIHQRYGDSILSHNKIMLEYLDSNSEKLSKLISFNNLALASKKIQINTDSEVDASENRNYKDNSTQATESVADTNDLKLDTKANRNVKQNSVMKTYAESVAPIPKQNIEESAPSVSWSDLMEQEDEEKKSLVKPIPNQPSPSTPKPFPSALSDEDLEHLISDVILVTKVGYNVSKNPRANAPLTKLADSMDIEIKRRKESPKYKPNSNGKFDGVISLVKEVSCTHSIQELDNWDCFQRTDRGSSCLLNDPVFQNISSDDGNMRLESLCIKIFDSLALSSTISQENKSEMIEAVKFTLSTDNYSDSYKWIVQAAKSALHSRSASRKASKMIDCSETTKKWNTLANNPTMDEELYEFMNIHLDSIVTSIVNETKMKFTSFKSKSSLKDYMLELSTIFLSSKSTWRNQTSFSDPKHLAKLQSLASTKVQTLDNPKLYKLLQEILDNLRDSFKNRKSSK